MWYFTYSADNGNTADFVQVFMPSYAISKDAGDALAHALGNREPDALGPADALIVAQKLAEDAVLIYANAHRFWNGPSVMQGIWNLRSAFKVNGRVLVLLSTPGATLPPELAQDVLVLDEPLTSASYLERIVMGTFQDAGLDEPDGDLIGRAVDALVGLAAFPAEQSLAIAKATGNTAGIPTIAFDLTAMESSLVGASGDRLRRALKVVEAVSQERALFIATYNSITSLPPELRRRFTLGTFFFDLPTAEEREAI